jgi:hypothetical protein
MEIRTLPCPSPWVRTGQTLSILTGNRAHSTCCAGAFLSYYGIFEHETAATARGPTSSARPRAAQGGQGETLACLFEAQIGSTGGLTGIQTECGSTDWVVSWCSIFCGRHDEVKHVVPRALLQSGLRPDFPVSVSGSGSVPVPQRNRLTPRYISTVGTICRYPHRWPDPWSRRRLALP